MVVCACFFSDQRKASFHQGPRTGPTKGLEPQVECPLVAHLPAVVRSPRVLRRRLGGPQLPCGGACGHWPHSSEAGAPGRDTQGAAPPLCGALTFQSARTSRASSRRPPRVLPTMIQMGTCESSCLEISNVICKGRGGAVSTDYCPGAPGRRQPGAGQEGRRQLAAGGRAASPSPGRHCRGGRHTAC